LIFAVSLFTLSNTTAVTIFTSLAMPQIAFINPIDAVVSMQKNILQKNPIGFISLELCLKIATKKYRMPMKSELLMVKQITINFKSLSVVGMMTSIN